MELNNYIFSNRDNLVNLTTKKFLPLDSSAEVLREHHFLKGQEQESVEKALFDVKPKSFEIKIIPTWECNLRCSHCFVLHELVKKDENRIDIEGLVKFIRAYVKKYPSVESGRFQFIGGEPALRSKFNCEIITAIKNLCEEIGLKHYIGCTTNGYELNDDILEFYRVLDGFTVSVDGPKHLHDKQRKPLLPCLPNLSPFDKTIQTIKTLVKSGMRDKITVQASLDDDGFNEEVITSFYKTLLMAGIKYESIMFGTIVPTAKKPEMQNKFVEVCANRPYTNVCCKYRMMHDFVVDSSNNIFCDYFDADQGNCLGKLSDDIEKLAKEHKKIITAEMSVLNDDKCKKCPVIGICWGWCCNTKHMIPSEHCSPDNLQRRVEENGKVGNLKNFLVDYRKYDVTMKGLTILQ